MLNSLKLYIRYIGISIRGQLQFRASFIMMMLGNFLASGIEFFGVWALFDRFGMLGEWKLSEVALFYGVINMSFAISEAWSRGFDTFGRLVSGGDFDRVLLRPRSTVFQIIAQDLQLMRVGRFIQGLLILIWSVSQLGGTWTLQGAILLIAAIAGGACLFSGLFVFQATLAFWTVQGLEIANIFTYGGVEAAQYPLSIYKGWFRKFFIYIVPLACINYFPVLGILNRQDPLHYPGWMQWFSPAAGVLFLLAAFQVWKMGVRHYHSTGS